MKETTGLLPNILSGSYQRIDDLSIGVSSDQAQIEIGEQSLNSMEHKIDNIKDDIEESIHSKSNANDTRKTEDGSKSSIDIVKAIMEDTIVTKIIPDETESSLNSSTIAKDIVDDLLDTNVLHSERDKKSNNQNVPCKSPPNSSMKEPEYNYMQPSYTKINVEDNNKDSLKMLNTPNTLKSSKSSTGNKNHLNAIENTNAENKDSIDIGNNDTSASKLDQLSASRDLEVVDISSGEEEDNDSENSTNGNSDDETGKLRSPKVYVIEYSAQNNIQGHWNICHS